MTTAKENHHWFAIKWWLNPYDITDKERRITNNIKYLKPAAASINCVAFVFISSEFIYFVYYNYLLHLLSYYTYYNRIKKSIKINQFNKNKI